MAEKLDFKLPEKKARGSVAGVLTVLLLILLVALVGANLFLALGGDKSTPATTDGFSPEQTKALATRLTQRGLHRQAAAAWQDYLATTVLAESERARTHFHIGDLLEKAGLYAEAIEHFYRSEAAAEVEELGPQINAHVKQCFERLGKFSALRYELMDRTSIDQGEPAGGKIVAEIGAEKITEGRLDALIEESIEDQLEAMRPFMTAEQLDEQKKQASTQLRAPQAKQEFLQNWLAQEVLYRQALEEKLAEKPEVKRLVHALTRDTLSRQLMNERLASRVNITDGDLQTYYTANKDTYVDPARAKISHILVDEAERANELLKRLREGADFAVMAKESSLDESTKDNGGRVEADVLKGSFVSGIGDSEEINQAIFGAAGPALLDRPFKTDKGWEIVKVEEYHGQREKGFEEVRQQVTMELARRKSQEVQQGYIREMMDTHKVVIHTSALAPTQQESSAEVPAKP